jgi:hypothetical protein
MKKVYQIRLWHGVGKGSSSWMSDQEPQVQNGVFRFKSQEGTVHMVSGNVEVSEFEQVDQG